MKKGFWKILGEISYRELDSLLLVLNCGECSLVDVSTIETKENAIMNKEKKDSESWTVSIAESGTSHPDPSRMLVLVEEQSQTMPPWTARK